MGQWRELVHDKVELTLRFARAVLGMGRFSGGSRMITLPVTEIAALGTLIATHGAIRVAELAGDDIFETLIAIAVLVYETYPNQ